jgi:hypothetical protein
LQTFRILLIYGKISLVIIIIIDLSGETNMVAKGSRTSGGGSNSNSLPKLTIPGVLHSEILELEPFFPDMRRSLAVLAFIIVIIAQLRIAAGPKLKATEFSRLESVNLYIRRALAKSPEMLSIVAAVAIRRTIGVYATEDVGDEQIKADVLDLTTHLEGPSSSKENLRAIMGSPERVRKFRRGIMLQVTGAIQASVIHHPKRIHPSVELITGQNFVESLPFPQQDLTLESVITRTKEILGLTSDSITFVDGIKVSADPSNTTPLEKLLGVTRELGTKTIAELKLPTNIDAQPAWKRAAITQAKSIYGGE